MELTLVLGAAAVVGGVVVFGWALMVRPSAARGNLLAAVEQPAPQRHRTLGFLRQVGQSSRRLIPNFLVDGLEVKLVQAGYPLGLDLPRIIGVKVLLATLAAAGLLISGHVVLAVISAVLLFFLPDYWVLSERDKRQQAIQSDAADIVDQLTICVEAGLGFDAALGRVAETTTGPFGEELRHTMIDMQAGVPRAQALRAMAERAQIVEIRQLVTALLQSQKHGVPIAETLRIQSTEMRMKRKQRTEEKAAKLAVKLLFPVVFCFVPAFMVIMLVPSLISISRSL
jgi:tight adherence protein C